MGVLDIALFHPPHPPIPVCYPSICSIASRVPELPVGLPGPVRRVPDAHGPDPVHVLRAHVVRVLACIGGVDTMVDPWYWVTQKLP